MVIQIKQKFQSPKISKKKKVSKFSGWSFWMWS